MKKFYSPEDLLLGPRFLKHNQYIPTEGDVIYFDVDNRFYTLRSDVYLLPNNQYEFFSHEGEGRFQVSSTFCIRTLCTTDVDALKTQRCLKRLTAFFGYTLYAVKQRVIDSAVAEPNPTPDDILKRYRQEYLEEAAVFLDRLIEENGVKVVQNLDYYDYYIKDSWPVSQHISKKIIDYTKVYNRCYTIVLLAVQGIRNPFNYPYPEDSKLPLDLDIPDWKAWKRQKQRDMFH